MIGQWNIKRWLNLQSENRLTQGEHSWNIYALIPGFAVKLCIWESVFLAYKYFDQGN